MVADTSRCHYCHLPFGTRRLWRGRTVPVVETFHHVTAGLAVQCCSLCLRLRAARLPNKTERLRVIAQTLKLERDADARERVVIQESLQAKFPRLRHNGPKAGHGA